MENFNLEEECWITTVSGKRFYPFDPQPEQIDIFDIAHALSLICRFNGHVSSFYSIAEHSIRVVNLVPEEYRMWALLHDAAEAYICDIARPIKKCECLAGYCNLEDKILAAIAAKFNLKGDKVPEQVKNADHIMLLMEKRDLIPHAKYQSWEGEHEVHGDTIIPLTPETAKQYFISTFLKLNRR